MKPRKKPLSAAQKKQMLKEQRERDKLKKEQQSKVVPFHPSLLSHLLSVHLNCDRRTIPSGARPNLLRRRQSLLNPLMMARRMMTTTLPAIPKVC
jgi:hypothetical protein